MWIAEGTGDFLEGRRLWLRPGKTYLFGRVQNKEVHVALDHKTVSRKHFKIEIEHIDDDKLNQVHSRTGIVIHDCKSKAGTSVNNQSLKNESVKPHTNEISIRPGTSPQVITLKWLPQIVTVVLTKKEVKNGLLLARQRELKDCDIRVTNEYLPAHTKYVVSPKRNVPRCLQALIEGRPIVTPAYIEALVRIIAVSPGSQPAALSPLEKDFDANWPDPTPFLPPRGKELTSQPDQAYKPNLERARIFEKHAIFFFTQAQYDTLLPCVTTGHGKAHMIEVVPSKTTPTEGLTFVREHVPRGGHAIVVQVPSDDGDDQEKAILQAFVTKLCQQLGQEAASQTNFIDAILANDASRLRPRAAVAQQSVTQQSSNAIAPAASTPREVSEPNRSPANEDISSASVATQQGISSSYPSEEFGASQSQGPQNDVDLQATEEDEDPRPRKRIRVIPTQRKRVAFDDGFDQAAVAAYEESSAEEDSPSDSANRSSSGRDAAASPARAQSPAIKEEPVQTPAKSKRVTSHGETHDDAHDLDSLLPATTARGRAKARQRPTVADKESSTTLEKSQSKSATNGKRSGKAVDGKDSVLKRIDPAEEKLKEEKQILEDFALGKVEINGPAKVVQVKSFQLPDRQRPNTASGSSHGPEWKPEWQGRKNFKAFRRARDLHPNAPVAQQKVVIPLAPMDPAEMDRDFSPEPVSNRTGKQPKSTRAARSTTSGQKVISIDDDSSDAQEAAPARQPTAKSARRPLRRQSVSDSEDGSTGTAERAQEPEARQNNNPTTVTKKTNTRKRQASSSPTGSSTNKFRRTARFGRRKDSDSESNDSDADKPVRGRRLAYGITRGSVLHTDPSQGPIAIYRRED